jgi:hypothetical protein
MRSDIRKGGGMSCPATHHAMPMGHCMRERAVMAKIRGFHRGKSSDVIMVQDGDNYTVAKGTEFKGKGRPSVTTKVETTDPAKAREAFNKLKAEA